MNDFVKTIMLGKKKDGLILFMLLLTLGLIKSKNSTISCFLTRKKIS